MGLLIRCALLALLLIGPQGPAHAAPADGAAVTLDHVAILASDARATATFYQNVFGFRELKTPFPAGTDVVWLDIGNGTSLHIFGGNPTSSDPRERHLAFTVPDVGATLTTLQRMNLEWQDFNGMPGRVQTRPDGVRQFFLRAPDDYWIEVNGKPK